MTSEPVVDNDPVLDAPEPVAADGLVAKTVQVMWPGTIEEPAEDGDGVRVVDIEMWRDVAVVRVAPRTQRKTVIREALEREDVKALVGEDGARFRVLDGASAQSIPVGPDPEPRLRIG